MITFGQFQHCTARICTLMLMQYIACIQVCALGALVLESSYACVAVIAACRQMRAPGHLLERLVYICMCVCIIYAVILNTGSILFIFTYCTSQLKWYLSIQHVLRSQRNRLQKLKTLGQPRLLRSHYLELRRQLSLLNRVLLKLLLEMIRLLRPMKLPRNLPYLPLLKKLQLTLLALKHIIPHLPLLNKQLTVLVPPLVLGSWLLKLPLPKLLLLWRHQP